MLRPCNAFHVDQGVLAGGQGVLGSGQGQIDPHPALGPLIGGRIAQEGEVFPAVQEVVSRTAFEGVRPEPPDQGVIPCASEEIIVQSVAGQPVVVRRPDEMRDSHQGVAARADGVLGSRDPQIHLDSGPGVGIGGGVPLSQEIDLPAAVQGVVSGFAGQRVQALASDQDIVSRPALQDVVPGAASNHVIPGTADHVVEVGKPADDGSDPVPGAVDGPCVLQHDHTGLGDGDAQIHRHGGVVRGEVQRVGSAPGFLQAEKLEPDIARPDLALENGPVLEYKGVVPQTVDEPLDVGHTAQDVHGIGHGHRAVRVDGEGEVRGHPGEIEGVEPSSGALDDRVLPPPVLEPIRVVPRLPLEDVHPGAAVQDVVSLVPLETVCVGGADQAVESRQVGQTGENAPRGTGKGDGVVLTAACEGGSPHSRLHDLNAGDAARNARGRACGQVDLDLPAVPRAVEGVASGTAVDEALKDRMVLEHEGVVPAPPDQPADPLDPHEPADAVGRLEAALGNEAQVRGCRFAVLHGDRSIGVQGEEKVLHRPGEVQGAPDAVMGPERRVRDDITAPGVLEGIAVRAAPAVQLIVARSALDPVLPGIPGEDVVVAGADQVLDGGQCVRVPGAVRGRAPPEVRLDTCAVHCIGGRVRPCPSKKRIVPCASHEGVVSIQPLDSIVFDTARQDVVMQRAFQVLDLGKRVRPSARRVLGDLGAEIHGHTGRGPRIGDPVDACAAHQHVVPLAAGEHIVSIAAVERIVFLIPGQEVVPQAARRILESAQTGGSRGDPGGKVHAHGGGVMEVIHRVGAGPTVDGPREHRTVLEDEPVVPLASDEPLHAGDRAQNVVPVRHGDRAVRAHREREPLGDRREVQGVHTGRAGLVDGVPAPVVEEEVGVARVGSGEGLVVGGADDVLHQVRVLGGPSAEQGARFDRPRAVLQVPVAAPCPVAGGVCRCGHIDSGEIPEPLHKGKTRLSPGHVAAVEKEVPVRGQGRSQRCEHRGGRVQLLPVHEGASEAQHAHGPVGDDVHGADPPVRLENLANLFDPVPVGLQHDDLVNNLPFLFLLFSLSGREFGVQGPLGGLELCAAGLRSSDLPDLLSISFAVEGFRRIGGSRPIFRGFPPIRSRPGQDPHKAFVIGNRGIDDDDLPRRMLRGQCHGLHRDPLCIQGMARLPPRGHGAVPGAGRGFGHRTGRPCLRFRTAFGDRRSLAVFSFPRVPLLVVLFTGFDGLRLRVGGAGLRSGEILCFRCLALRAGRLGRLFGHHGGGNVAERIGRDFRILGEGGEVRGQQQPCFQGFEPHPAPRRG